MNKRSITTETLKRSHLPSRRQERPDPDWVRGTCPVCGSELVSNAYYVRRAGYILLWECWESLGDAPTCSYRSVL